MPVHDWTRVEAGIFHAFHQQWIISLCNALNEGILPEDYYALPEQHAAGFGPDVLTLQGLQRDRGDCKLRESPGSKTGLLVGAPKLNPGGETDMEFYRRKQTSVTLRYVSDDHVVAMIEIVSRGNKSTRHALRSFVEKAAQLLDQGVHLLIVDLIPPGRHDPHGVHAAIWEEISGEEYAPPAGRPLTLVAYETVLTVRYYVEPVAVGEVLPEMPLFLEPNGCVGTPLEATYQTAFAAMPRRWRRVLDPMKA